VSAGAYLVDGDGLTAMRPSAPPDEARLQALIETHSDLVGQADGRLLLVSREQGVPDTEQGAGRWSLDHLFFTCDAVPVLVEVKRAVDSRLRREVIGQLLDYAANGTAYWGEAALSGAFALTCAARGEEPEAALAAFLGEEGRPEGFWGRVEANLRDGRVRLLIVADRIPAELARIVEFLNEQMRAEVLAIELRHFEAEDGRLILVPREIGQSEQLRLRKGAAGLPDPVTPGAWLDREIGAPGTPARDGAEIWLDVWRGLADGVEVTRRQESLAVRLQHARGSPARPAHVWKKGTCSFGLMRAREPRRDVFGSEAARLAFFEPYREAFPDLSPASPHGWPAFPLTDLLAPERQTTFRRLAREWIAGWQEGAA
jgi:hypothetical protein